MIPLVLRVYKIIVRFSKFADIVHEIELSQESHIFHKISWDKKLDGFKFTDLFNKNNHVGGLDFNRKEKY